jgi:hypothetical protein
MYIEVLLLLTYSALFSMLFDLSQTLYNPFGPRNLDLPHTLLVEAYGGLRRGLLLARISLGTWILIMAPGTVSKHL